MDSIDKSIDNPSDDSNEKSHSNKSISNEGHASPTPEFYTESLTATSGNSPASSIPREPTKLAMETQGRADAAASFSTEPVATNRPTEVRAVNSNRRRIRGFSGLLWLATVTALFVGVVFVGPKIVEEYSYAHARGKSRAEYEIAKVALKERPLDGISTMFEYVAKKISPSVVHIDTISSQFKGSSLIYLQNSKGQGSGVIYSEDGYIVTNQHVVAGAREIRVTLYDRSVYQARVIGIDERTDLAVLKIEASGLTPGEWANEDEIRVGSMAWAVGSPFGLDQSITSGIVSGRHRRVKSPQSQTADYVFKDLIQTDAAINPGNSGGPLVNAVGDIMGINTSIIGGNYQGVCFAVPSPIVERIAEQLIEKGFVERGLLGVYPEQVSFEYAKSKGLTDYRGAFVQQVAPESPAENAGIEPGDIIRKWNDKTVESELTLFTLVANAEAETDVNLVIFRDGKEFEKVVTIAARPTFKTIVERPRRKLQPQSYNFD